jgi:hypothetical protein
MKQCVGTWPFQSVLELRFSLAMFMAMKNPDPIKEIQLHNYRSFMDACCRLSPLTLVVGRNNVGKSNFLKAFRSFFQFFLSGEVSIQGYWDAPSHYQSSNVVSATGTSLVLKWTNDQVLRASVDSVEVLFAVEDHPAAIPEIYTLDPSMIGEAEPAEVAHGVIPKVLPDGKGVTAVLRMLIQGNASMQQKFRTIEAQWKQCLPEIKTLHLAPTGPSRLMVEQHEIPGSQPLSDLSDGARLMLAILTLVHQESPPRLILLEDLDHRIHARLFEPLVRFLRQLTQSGAVTQIIATTHNPYLVDEFIDEPEAVVLVEKHDGRSTLVNLDDRLKLYWEQGEQLDPEEMPLGQFLFSGFADAPKPARVPATANS